jgi:hypothetical protein
MNGESFRLKQSKTKNKPKPTERHPLGERNFGLVMANGRVG